jgi:wyosine [tRNA(Phe)-imidazoG37] synthetase (radical SAM superfamily)
LSEPAGFPSQVHIYGPVPSRRLGYSLGVDILPYKTCTLDCVYCQLGPTPETTDRAGCFFEEQDILSQIQDAVTPSRGRIDYITFSGSGEPTLNAGLGSLIRKIKAMTDIPVAVLTNGTLLTREEVRQALMEADLVVPSLDAATQEVFERVNRPHPCLEVRDIIQSLIRFRQEYRGRFWLEVMLVAGINDSPEHIRELKEAAASIHPDRVQLNTVVRPPAEGFARALTQERMEEIREIFGPGAEIIADFSDEPRVSGREAVEAAIVDLVKRRPVTLTDLANSLGLHRNEVIKHLDLLRKDDKIRVVFHKGRKYYEPSGE